MKNNFLKLTFWNYRGAIYPVENKRLTLYVPILDKVKKIKLNFCFHTSLWCLKRSYEGLKGLHKTFLRHHKEVWKKSLIFSLGPGLGRERLPKFEVSIKLETNNFTVVRIKSRTSLNNGFVSHFHLIFSLSTITYSNIHHNSHRFLPTLLKCEYKMWKITL